MKPAPPVTRTGEGMKGMEASRFIRVDGPDTPPDAAKPPLEAIPDDLPPAATRQLLAGGIAAVASAAERDPPNWVPPVTVGKLCPVCGRRTHRTRAPWYLRPLRWLLLNKPSYRECPAYHWSGLALHR